MLIRDAVSAKVLILRSAPLSFVEGCARLEGLILRSAHLCARLEGLILRSAHLCARLEGWLQARAVRPSFETAGKSAGLLRMRLLLVAALAAATPLGASAQVKVRTESIRPAGAPPAANQFVPPAPQSAPAAARLSAEAAANDQEPASSPSAGPEIATDQTRVPPAVAETRARILAVAATGDLNALGALMRAKTPMPAFSHTQRQDPIAYWKELYPDSGGIEILGILTSILDTAPAHLNAGTSQEIYVWPYFARLPIAALTPAQKVELFRVVTGFDYKGMLERGRYVFYQVGITPDGAWRYFLASDE